MFGLFKWSGMSTSGSTSDVSQISAIKSLRILFESSNFCSSIWCHIPPQKCDKLTGKYYSISLIPIHSEQEACWGKIFLCVRMASLHRFVLFRSQCQEQTLWKERSKVKWWGKHREIFEDREKRRRRERATDGRREAGVVVEFCVLSCRSPFPLSLLLSLSGCFYSLSTCHLLSITSILISRPFVLFIISDTFWLSPAKQRIFASCVVHLKHCQINTCRCPRDSIDSPLIYEWERSNHSYDVCVGMNEPLGVYISYSI